MTNVIIYGDYEHDDTYAINAWLAGADAIWEDGSEVGDTIVDKIFYVDGTVFLPSGEHSYKRAVLGCYLGKRGLSITDIMWTIENLKKSPMGNLYDILSTNKIVFMYCYSNAGFKIVENKS